jgi:D-cysteine desulfhydrase
MRSYGVKVDAGGFERGRVKVLENYLGDCYGAVTEAGLRAVELAAEHGIALETTYSAKAFAALKDFVKTLSPRSGPVLFWNTFNSRDLSSRAEAVDPNGLPASFHRFFAGTLGAGQS